MNKEIKWAVLGTGVIANEMATALQKMGKKLYSVGNRTHEKAVDFAKKYGVEKVYDTIEDLFLDDEVDVVYLTTPHNTHYEFMKKALTNGKHVFVEKSITLNSRELDEMSELAKKNNLIIGEAMTIWHMPIYKKLWEDVKNEKYGKVQMITVNFGSFKEYNMENRFFNMNLAGGALLDIGVYAISVVRSFMDEKPDEVVSQWMPSPTGSDERATILLKNKKNQMATIALAMHSKQPKRTVISMEKAYVELMEFPRAHEAVIVDAETGEKEIITEGRFEDALFYEMQDMEYAIETGDTTGLLFEYTKDVMDIMTKLRKEWNMRYPKEVW
ncbi:MAG: Gfo/Idh/MocA family oxidoreductase [Lachnospiraceae bacterium]|nr:Gfo/Idh/MocA family oxidoreductase [Lachnospiraceae bacterium]